MIFSCCGGASICPVTSIVTSVILKKNQIKNISFNNKTYLHKFNTITKTDFFNLMTFNFKLLKTVKIDRDDTYNTYCIYLKIDGGNIEKFKIFKSIN